MGKSRAILNIDISTTLPDVLSTTPLSLGAKGLPVIFNTDEPIGEWYIIRVADGLEMELPTSWLQYDSGFGAVFYEADEDIITYLDGEGFQMACGKHYYKFVSGGRIRYSQILFYP